MSRRAVRVAGLGYTATWCVGLAVFSSSTTVSSTGRELLGQYAGHSPVLALQFLLTQGLAAVLLGIVLAAWVGMATGTGRVLVAWAGGAAVTVSLVQCALGLVLAVLAVPAGDPGPVAALGTTLDRLDGVKMLLLAVVLGTIAVGSPVRRPRWLAALCSAGAASLLVSALGYAFLADLPAMAAFVSLPLLLASVSAGAFVVRPIRVGGPVTVSVRGG